MAMCDTSLIAFATNIKKNKFDKQKNKFNNQWYIDFSQLKNNENVVDTHKKIFWEDLKKYLWLELDEQIKEKFVKEWEDLFLPKTDENWGK